MWARACRRKWGRGFGREARVGARARRLDVQRLVLRVELSGVEVARELHKHVAVDRDEEGGPAQRDAHRRALQDVVRDQPRVAAHQQQPQREDIRHQETTRESSIRHVAQVRPHKHDDAVVHEGLWQEGLRCDVCGEASASANQRAVAEDSGC